MALKECLGVKIEVQFKERNIGSPFFGQVDSYLSKDFYLSSLEPFLSVSYTHLTLPTKA